MEHLKKVFSRDNLRSILKVGGPIGVTAGILLCFGFADPDLVLPTLLSIQGTALYDLLKESFSKKEYDENAHEKLCEEIQRNKKLQADLTSFFEKNWDDILSIMKNSDEAYKHLLYRNIGYSTQILENFNILYDKIDNLYGELGIKNFDIYLENEDPLQSFENVKKNIDSASDIIDRSEVSKIIEHFKKGDGLLVLEGFPTSGKSFVAYLVAREWLKSGGRVAVLRQGEVLQEREHNLLGKEIFLTIVDQNNELSDMAFRNVEQSARKCLITRRLGEFAEPSTRIESRLTENFVTEEDYLYSTAFVQKNIRCFLGEFKEIEKYVKVCEKRFDIRVEKSESDDTIKRLTSLSLIEREEKRSSTAVGLIYSIFIDARERKFEILDLKNVNEIVGGKIQFKAIFENIYKNSWNEDQKKLARAMKLLNLCLGDYVFNRTVVEKAYEAYHNSLGGYESALVTLRDVKAVDYDGHIAFWHPFQLDVVDVMLSDDAKTGIVRRLISGLEDSSHGVGGSERMEILLTLARISFPIDPSKSLDIIRTLRKENEYFGRLGIAFVISKAIDGFFPNFDFGYIRTFFELIKTRHIADLEIRTNTLSIIFLLTVRERLEEKESLVESVIMVALELLEKGEEQENFYSMCVSNIAESKLSGEEKERWIQKIETMAKGTLEKGNEQANFYSMCVSNIAESKLSGEEKERWIVKIETMAKGTLEKGEEQENFYSMCVSNIAESKLSGEEKERWIVKIETMAKGTLEKGEEQENFYSMCVSNIAESKLSGEEKHKYADFICSLVKKFDFETQQIIFSYCLVRTAHSRLPCSYAKLILLNSSDKENLRMRSEDLIFDFFLGEESSKILGYLQNCLRHASNKN